MPKAFVKMDLRGLRRIRADVRAGVSARSPEGRRMLERWGLSYLAFLQRRFLRNSAGGGEWKPLAPSTVESDKRKGRRRLGLLRITSAIYLALFKGRAGNLFQIVGSTLRVGLGGGARHPGSDITVAGLAIIHNTGAGNVPERRIIVPPDVRVAAEMRQASADFGRELTRKAS